jgi:hypothetical protein
MTFRVPDGFSPESDVNGATPISLAAFIAA